MISSKITEEELVMKKRVGYWLSQKKAKRLNFKKFEEICRNSGIELVLMDLDVDLEKQGCFDAILHKASDLIIFGDQGDAESARRVRNISKFLGEHSDVLMLDPLPSVRLLCDRYLQYSLLRAVADEDQVLTPAFTDLTSSDLEENKSKLKKSGVTFPIICKPIVAHGSSFAHQMALIFCEKRLSDMETPCVAQSFIPHDAVLYKVFVVGNRHFLISRPSVKNLEPGDFPSVFFDSHEVSKDGCTSELSKVEGSNLAECIPPSEKKIRSAIKSIVTCTNLSLFGVDIIVETGTKQCYAIDINAFPSYDGVPDFFHHLLEHLRDRLKIDSEEYVVYEQHYLDQEGAPIAASKPPLPSRRDSASLTDDWFLTRGLSSTIHGSARFPGIAKLLEEEKRRRTARMTEIVETASPTHARSVDNVALRGKSPSDSGIGSCTESDTSDCEKKLKEWKLEAERRKSGGSGMEGFKKGEFFPDWKRIKKFYGIPKPGVPQSQEEFAEEEHGANSNLVVTIRQSSESADGGGKTRAGTIP